MASTGISLQDWARIRKMMQNESRHVKVWASTLAVGIMSWSRGNFTGSQTSLIFGYALILTCLASAIAQTILSLREKNGREGR
ncbi:MAG TPA: hypothetical protein VJB12_03345 [Candidatus Nanoarchaeia archaeon]|nr:hypothetical protein [Candidatus Nanoarchaeia archaeon]